MSANEEVVVHIFAGGVEMMTPELAYELLKMFNGDGRTVNSLAHPLGGTVHQVGGTDNSFYFPPGIE